MRICYLTRSLKPENGGLDRYSFEVVSAVEGDGQDVTALVEQSAGLSYERVILKPGRDVFSLLRNIFMTRKLIGQYDIVHALDLFPYGLIAAGALIGKKNRLFITGVGTDSVARIDHPWFGWILKWVYRKAERVFCISKYTKERILEKVVDLANLEVIYLGIDPQKFSTERINQNSTPSLIGVGALKRRKGYHITIAAVSKIKDKYHGLKYYIIGSQAIDKFFEKLKKQVSDLGLEDTVMFLEDISDQELRQLYGQSDVFVLTSINVGQHFEGYGLVFLEAASAGLPSVGTRNCGIEEAVLEGKTGLLVEQENIDQTAEALDKLLSDQQLRESMGQNARKFAQSLSWENTVSQYVKFYQNV